MHISGSKRWKFTALCALAAATALGPQIASATLGEPEASVQTDVAQLQGSIKTSTDRSLYRVHEIQLPSGTTLREYVAANGTVFAVAWKGPYAPNLRQAFGRYFEPYVAAARVNRTDRNHVQIIQDDLVVQVRAHMHAFSGRAYLPASLPSGVELGDLQ